MDMPACGVDLGRTHTPSPTRTEGEFLSHLQGAVQLFEHCVCLQLCLLSPVRAHVVLKF